MTKNTIPCEGQCCDSGTCDECYECSNEDVMRVSLPALPNDNESVDLAFDDSNSGSDPCSQIFLLDPNKPFPGCIDPLEIFKQTCGIVGYGIQIDMTPYQIAELRPRWVWGCAKSHRDPSATPDGRQYCIGAVLSGCDSGGNATHWSLTLFLLATGATSDCNHLNPVSLAITYQRPRADGCVGEYTATEIVDGGEWYGTVYDGTARARVRSMNSNAECFDGSVDRSLVGFWPTLNVECIPAEYAEYVQECQVPCAEPCLQVAMGAPTNGTCSDCSQFLEIIPTFQVGPCLWESFTITEGHCIASIPGASYLKWTVAYDLADAQWVASLVAYNSSNVNIGTVVNYVFDGEEITGNFTFLSGSSICNWPDEITIQPCLCPGDSTCGACCQDADSFGIAKCGNLPEAVCAELGGTFLGVGTDCFEEGCAGCEHPTPCSLFPASYTLTIAGVTGDCADLINGTVVLTGGGQSAGSTGCNWTGSYAFGSVSLDADLGGVPWHFTAILNGVDAQIEIAGNFETCDGSECPIMMTLQSNTGAGCIGADFSAATMTLAC